MLFLLFAIFKMAATHEIDSHEHRMIKIEALQGIKHDLFDQIKYSIDDSLNSLKDINNAEALIGISYIRDLKDRLAQLDSSYETKNNMYNRRKEMIGAIKPLLKMPKKQNRAPSVDAVDPQSPPKEAQRTSDLKKSGKAGKGAIRQLYVESDKENLWDPKKIFGDPKSPKYKERKENREKVQKALEDWLKQRDIIKKNKLDRDSTRLYKDEKCPPQGITKIAIKGKVGQKRNGIVPCCRKCCKRSYLGCL